MTYATQQDLIDRFGSQEILELTDRGGFNVIDTTVVSRALDDATAEINGYLAAQYALPLVSIPTVLARLCSDIARYYLFDDRVTEAVKMRYDSAIKFLKSVSMGQVSLGIDTASNKVASSGAVSITGGNRTFDRSTLSDY